MENKTSNGQLLASRRYYNRNRETRKIKMNEYYANNAERIKARRRERYRLQKTAASDHTTLTVNN